MTTIDLDACAGRHREAAEGALRSALHADPIPASLLAAWRAMQKSTCDDLVGLLLEGGSIQSMVETSCEARLTDEFAQTLRGPRYPLTRSSLDLAFQPEKAFAARYRQQLSRDRERAFFDRAEAIGTDSRHWPHRRLADRLRGAWRANASPICNRVGSASVSGNRRRGLPPRARKAPRLEGGVLAGR